MANKSYKNVYTILEKVKKGEIESHYKDKEGLFGKINFYRKPDLVKPYLHYLDERRIENIMDEHFRNKDSIKKMYSEFTSSTQYKKLEEVKKPSFDKFRSEVESVYHKKFPKHLTKDIFKMYYNKIEKLDFEDRDDKNHGKFKFLERSNNPVGKIMSENSQLKSAVFTKNVVSYFISQLAMLKFVDEEQAEEMEKNMKGGGDEFSNDKIDQIMEKMLDNASSKKMLDSAINEAQDTCKALDQNMSEDQQDQMFEATSSGSSEAAKLDGDYINRVARSIQNVKLSLGSLKDKIKKLLDKSASYFSAKEEVKYEDLFNADSIAGLDEYVLLHPKLRKFMAEDINIKETKKVGKIDIYIDISGSMSSPCGVKNNDGHPISKLDFCKSFAYKLKDMDMLNEIYTFENKVEKIKSDVISIAMLHDRGGTDINKAVNKIVNNGVNAIVITDAEDHCSVYSEKAFFIGVQGANFGHFEPNIIKEYSNRDQVIVFNGTEIHKVNEKGYIIN